MRLYGTHVTQFDIPKPPDSVQTLLIAGSSGQASNWPNGAGQGSTLAQGTTEGNAHIARFTGVSTAGALLNFMVNLVSTHCSAPASGSSLTTGTTAGSTGNNIPVNGQRLFQIPSWSTGFSVAALSSGYVMVETWQRA